MNANHDDIERMLTDAMREEVQDAMTMTNTPEELRKFRHTIEQDRKRRRVYAITAATAAVVVVAGVGVAVAVKESGRPHRGQVTTPLGSQTATPSTQPSERPSESVASGPPVSPVDAPSALAGGVQTAKVEGPGVLGLSALGSVWGVQDEENATGNTGHVYRLDPTGQKILSSTPYAWADADDLPPFQAGKAVLVPHSVLNGPNAYLAVDATGRQIASITVAKLGLGAGDSTGGWAKSDDDAIIHIDASGTKVVKTVVLPGAEIAGVAVGGGSVWVSDQSQGQLLRVDPTSGKVTGTTSVGPVDQFLPIAYSNGAVYVPNQNYQLRRIDAATMKTTAVVSTPSSGSWFVISIGADGGVWAEPAQGVVDELDPATLATKRAIQLQPTTRDGGAFGVVATSTRVYMADGDDGYVLSFPLS
jgi:hypothetical protein